MKNFKYIKSTEFLNKLFEKTTYINQNEYKALCINLNKIIPEIQNIFKKIYENYLKDVYNKIFDPISLKKYNYTLKDFYKDIKIGKFNNSITSSLDKVTKSDFDPKQDEVYKKYHEESKYAKEHNKLYKPMGLIYESSNDLYANSKFCNCLWWIRDERGEITGRDKRFIAVEEVLLTKAYDWAEFQNASFKPFINYYFSALMESITFKFITVILDKYNDEFKKYGKFIRLSNSDGEIQYHFIGFAPNFKVKD